MEQIENQKSYEETVAEILGRWSVADLVEQTPETVANAARNFYKGTTDLKVVEHGVTNLINWWKVSSGEKVYEVRKFQTFAFCSCQGFMFRKGACCKHIVFCGGVPCENCKALPASVGKLCENCDANKRARQQSLLAA